MSADGEHPNGLRNDRNADTVIGELWTHEGLRSVIASPSKSNRLHLAGNVVLSKHEMEFDGVEICRYQLINTIEVVEEQGSEYWRTARRAGPRPAWYCHPQLRHH